MNCVSPSSAQGAISKSCFFSKRDGKVSLALLRSKLYINVNNYGSQNYASYNKQSFSCRPSSWITSWIICNS